MEVQLSNSNLALSLGVNDTVEALNDEMNVLLERLQKVCEKKRELTKNAKRNSLYPIISEKEKRAFDFYHRQQKVLWVPHEMKFAEDKNDYNAMSDDLKRLIDIPFGFFAGADADIIDELSFRFLVDAETYHELCYFLAQLYIESVHAETYALLISHLIENTEKKNFILNAAENMPVVKRIHNWMAQFMTGQYSDVERRCAAAVMEGIIFQAPFLFLFYFKIDGTMKNTRFANEQIQKDESLHADKGCDYVRHWRSENGRQLDSHFFRLVEEGRQLVREFSIFVLTRDDGSFIDIPYLGKNNVLTYCDTVSNRVLYQMGLEQKYVIQRSDIPEWMSDIGNTTKANFYENSVGNYSTFSTANLNTGDDDESEESDVDF